MGYPVKPLMKPKLPTAKTAEKPKLQPKPVAEKPKLTPKATEPTVPKEPLKPVVTERMFQDAVNEVLSVIRGINYYLDCGLSTGYMIWPEYQAARQACTELIDSAKMLVATLQMQAEKAGFKITVMHVSPLGVAGEFSALEAKARAIESMRQAVAALNEPEANQRLQMTQSGFGELVSAFIRQTRQEHKNIEIPNSLKVYDK